MKKSKHVVDVKTHYAPISVMAALLQAVREVGYDADAVLAEAGVDCSAAELVARGADGISMTAFARINQTCNNILRNHITLHHGCISMTEDQFGMLCRCVIHAANLEEAISLTATFFDMFEGRIGKVRLEVSGGRAMLHINRQHHALNNADFMVHILGFAVLHRLYSWLIDERIGLLSTHLVHPAPASSTLLTSLFADHEVSFLQPSNHFRFDSAYLCRPVVRTQQELHEICKLFPYDLLLSGYRGKPLAERVYQVMIDHYSNYCRLPETAQLAELFHMSDYTMRRRLTEEKTAYSKIRHRCQLTIIGDYLRRTEMTINEIAERSGFSDGSTFRRAFKQWTGKSPSDYRRVANFQ
jgi:AraC-like DNA-binding protein